MFQATARNKAVSRDLLNRFMQEQAAISPGNYAGRRRPMPPRNFIAQGGSLVVLLTWNSPQNDKTVIGFNIYQDNEGNRIANINDPNTRQFSVRVPASAPTAFYISSYNALQESVKVRVVGEASSDLYVVTGTGGGTPGTLPPLPPGYSHEPGGGAPNPRGPYYPPGN